MVKIRQVLRCYATELGSKTIAAHLGISRTPVKKYIHIYQTCGKTFAEIMSMGDMELYVLFQEQVKAEKKPVEITPRQAELDSLLPSYIDHKAGDKMFVDYAGDKLRCLCDKETGELIATETFVTILPCSHLTYAEVQMSQKKEDFIRRCKNALRFYGGTPAAIVPDNLKSAVTRHGKYESELNEDL